MSDTDLELLARYTRQRAEDAFAEIVRRHLDLVFSAALRQVRSRQLAEEVAQSTFISLARDANRLTPDTILAAWLYQVAHRTAANVVRREARRQLREHIATEMNAMNATPADWTHIEPLLDAAMHALDETDRAAVLLRYFENKPLREVGATLGTSENAAQKRLSRAIGRLREFFAKRGVTIGASGLGVVISAHAVQASPIGLAVTISTAASLAGTTVITTTTATATKAIAVTTLQKTLIAATLVAAVGTGLYEARQASTLRSQVQTLQRQPSSPNVQVEPTSQDRDEVARQLADLRQENERLNRQSAELLKLRGEVTRLKAGAQELARMKTVENQKPENPAELAAKTLLGKMNLLKQRLEETPDLNIPELQYLNDKALASIASDHDLETDDDVRQALCNLRDMAKQSFVPRMGKSLINYIVANNGQLPNEVLQLKPYFESPVDDALLQRYELLHTGKLSDLPTTEPLVAEKSPVDEKYESLYRIGAFGYSHQGGVGNSSGTGTWAPRDVERVRPFTRQN